jgi:hypothetical protein
MDVLLAVMVLLVALVMFAIINTVRCVLVAAIMVQDIKCGIGMH